MTTVTGGVNLVFTPITGIDCEVKVFGVQTQLHDQDGTSGIGSDNFFIKGDYGDYSGTKLDLLSHSVSKTRPRTSSEETLMVLTLVLLIPHRTY